MASSFIEGKGSDIAMQFGVCCGIFFGGLMINSIIEFGTQLRNSLKRRRFLSDEKYHEKKHRSSVSALRILAQQLSMDSVSGRAIEFINILAVIAACCLYVVQSTKPFFQKVDFASDPVIIVDTVLAIWFGIFFILKYISAESRIVFWLSSLCIVDCFTIPLVVITAISGDYWIGLRFLRFVRLSTLIDFLELGGIIHKQHVSDLARMIFTVLAMWITASGMTHLLENMGDPWNDFRNSQKLTLAECIYFVMVTMSTVGYGDFSPETTLGRLFIIIFIVGGIGLFASYIPAILEIFSSRRKYGGAYKGEATRRHLIVCGHVTAKSVHGFQKEFFHQDRDNEELNAVFLSPEEPDHLLKLRLKLYRHQLQFFSGTVLCSTDLDRVEFKTAQACVIIADKYSPNPDDEDSSNVLRAVALKNYYKKTPVILQLLKTESKSHLLNIPGWDWSCDSVVCLQEIKLGLMAQACLTPGLSTLLANLVGTHSFSHIDGEPEWKILYRRGASLEIYTALLSPSFADMPFHQIAGICYRQLGGLVLIAVEAHDQTVINSLCGKCGGRVEFAGINESFVLQGNSSSKLKMLCKCTCQSWIAINPQPGIITIGIGTRAFFIASDEHAANRVMIYCDKCHAQARTPEEFDKIECNCNYDLLGKNRCGATVNESALGAMRITSKNKVAPSTLGQTISASLSRNTCLEPITASLPKAPASLELRSGMRKSTWNDYTCVAQLRGQTIICVYGNKESSSIGLINLIAPLRSSFIPQHKHRPVVILGYLELVAREWDTLAPLGDIHFVEGIATSRAALLRAGILFASSCALLARTDHVPGVEGAVADKDAILTALSIKTLQAKVPLGIRTITELREDSNSQFLDDEDDDVADAELMETLPFVTGRCLTASLLDALVIETFFQRDFLRLMCELAAVGGDVEEENEFTPPDLQKMHRSDQAYCNLIALADPFYKQYVGKTFGSLFMGALTNGMICLGLYRLLAEESNVPGTNSRADTTIHVDSSQPIKATTLVPEAALVGNIMEEHRVLERQRGFQIGTCKHVVLTSPPANLVLRDTDGVYILTHW